MRPAGITFSYFMPGFIDTDMSRRYQGPRPFVISAERGARIIKKAIARRHPELIFPLQFRLAPVLLGMLPTYLGDRFFLSQSFGVLPDKHS